MEDELVVGTGLVRGVRGVRGGWTVSVAVER